MRFTSLLTLVTLASIVLPSAATGQTGATVLDDLHCVRIKDSLLAPARPPAVRGADGEKCKITGGATLACAPAHAALAGAREKEAREALAFDRLCYRVRCTDERAAESASVEDALGAHFVRRGATSLVCTPATIALPRTEAGGGPGGDGGGPGRTPADSHVEPTTCGDFNEDTNFTASDALGVLRAAVGSATCLICVCDVDSSNSITATDALKLLKFAVGQAITLTCQADGNPISWDGGGDGFSWTDPNNWSLDRIPNGCDDVTINDTPATVTHASGNNGARSIVGNSDVDLTGGTLKLRDLVKISGAFRLRGATLATADVLAPDNDAPLVLTATGGTLDNTLITADLDLSATSAFTYIQNGLALNGTATIGQSAGLYFQGSGEQQLAGTGEVQFTANGGLVYNYGGTTLRIGSDVLIHGAGGSVGGNQSNTSLINEGTILCDATGTTTVASVAGTTNTGTIGASDGGTLTLGGPWTNAGTFTLDSASTLNLGGVFPSTGVGTISRTGGTINLAGQMNTTGTFTLNAATGDWRLAGGKIVGGTIASADGAKLVYTSSGGTLDAVTMAADMDFGATSSFTYVDNGLTLNGTATIGQNAGLYFQGTGERQLAGTGEIQFTAGGGQVYNYGGVTLRIGSDVLIHGAGGSVGGNQSNTSLINDGTILCDAIGTTTVASVTGTTNTGTIGASDGGTLTLGGPWTNAGTFTLDSASTLNLGGAFPSTGVGTISRTGGTINLTGQMNTTGTFTLNAATGDWRLAGGKIVGGTIASADGAKLVYTSSGGTLDAVTMAADMDFSATSSFTYVDNGLILNGNATVGQNAGLYFQGTGEQQLAGAGEIQFTASGGQVYNYGGTTLRVGSDILIHGAGGSVGGNQSNTSLINDGTILCDATGTTTVASVAGTTSTGTIGASDGGTLTLGGPWTNAGTFTLDSASTLNLGGVFPSTGVGTISRTGGTINLTGQMNTTGTFTFNAATGDWRLAGGKIVGGTIASADGAKLVYTSSGGTLDAVTMAADMDFGAASSFTYVDNGLILNGNATVGQNAGLYFQGTGEQQLAGAGEIQFTASGGQVYNYGGTTLRIGSDILIHGAGGSVGGNQSNTSLINEGTIDCDAAGTMTIGAVNTWTNDGTLRASAGNLTAQGAWTNDGTVEIGAGRTLTSALGFAQGSGGELVVDLAGTAANDFGKMTVTGAASLGGTLTIALTNGFVPNIGDSFQIMTFASSSGSFGTINGLNIGGGKQLLVTVGATAVTVDVVAA